MFDLSRIRKEPVAFDAAMARRGQEPVAEGILALDKDRRLILTELQEAQARRNEISREIGKTKGAGKNANDLIAEMARLKADIQKTEEQERALGAELQDLLSGLPNLPLADVPDGENEDDNRIVHLQGEKPAFDFDPKEHFDLGEALGLMDFERAAKMSGSRFVVLSGGLARLERALGQFMLDLHISEHGYTEMAVPSLVKSPALYGTGQLPKFAGDLFKTEAGHWLIPTAEVPLTNFHADEILAEESLPRRYTALTPCYRAEAGSAGKDTRGMIRQHQFTKVELVSIVAPEQSIDELERLTSAAEEVLKRLGLHYRRVELCVGDLGFSASRTYDLEVWLPGQDRYREISSCSYCGDFQTRRMNMRCRKKGEKITRFPHSLNGSGLATGRTLVAVMENYQQADGSITVPEALEPYMGGLAVIEAR